MSRSPSSTSTGTENFPGADISPTGDEWEFLKAMERYQRRANRRYPSWREVLRVLRALGYRKVEDRGARIEDRADPPAA